MAEVADRIEQAGCHATRRGAWVCLPQSCNRDPAMCPERMVWGAGSYSYQDKPFPPGTMTPEELGQLDD